MEKKFSLKASRLHCFSAFFVSEKAFEDDKEGGHYDPEALTDTHSKSIMSPSVREGADTR